MDLMTLVEAGMSLLNSDEKNGNVTEINTHPHPFCMLKATCYTQRWCDSQWISVLVTNDFRHYLNNIENHNFR